jgi:hypothetical protein
MRKEDITYVLYFYIQEWVSRPAFEKGKNGIMTEKEVRGRMFEWRIPENLKPAIIKVWEQIGIAKRINRKEIKFTKTDFNINDIRYVNEVLGIY